jgi:hypothetical protein
MPLLLLSQWATELELCHRRCSAPCDDFDQEKHTMGLPVEGEFENFVVHSGEPD